MPIQSFTPQDIDINAGTGGDDAVVLQAFFDEISTTERVGASWAGSYRTSTQLTLGPATGTIATTSVSGQFKLTGTAAMQSLLTIRNAGNLHVGDPIWITGTGGASNASRTIFYGVRISENSNRIKFSNIRASCFGGFGVSQIWASGKNLNFNRYGQIQAYDCGSGYGSTGYTGNKTATFSARTDSGTSNSFGQRTQLTVSALPPADLTSFVAAGSAPIFVYISGKFYIVMSIGISTIDVFPWVSGSATTGSIDYVYGGAFFSYGSDANNAWLEGVDASRCGIGIADLSLYGLSAGRLQVGFTGIGHCFGIPLSSSSFGGIIGEAYFEGDVLANAAQISNVPGLGRVWVSTSAVDISKIIKIASPRSTNSLGQIYPLYSMVDGLAYPKNSRSIAYEPVWETHSSIAFNSSTSLDVTGLGDYNEVEIRFEDCIFAGACTLALRVSSDNGVTYSATGYQSMAANDAAGTTSTTSFAITDGTVTDMRYGVVRLSGFKDVSRRVQVEGILGGIHKIGGIWSTATRNSALRLLFSTQNWTAGSIVIRGLR